MARLLTQPEFAELLGASPRTVSSWREEGLPMTTDAKGIARVNSTEALIWWSDRRGMSAAKSNNVRIFEDARLKRAMADKAEYEARARSGELVERKVVDQVWAHAATAIRQRLLSVAASVAPRVGKRSSREIRAAIDAEVRAALEGLASSYQPLPEDEAG